MPERMTEAGTLHIYGPNDYNSANIRTWCPTHSRLHLALVVSYYDHWSIFFSCGAGVEPSEGMWIPDRRGPTHSKYKANTGRPRRITKKVWSHWQPYIVSWMHKIPAERDRETKP